MTSSQLLLFGRYLVIISAHFLWSPVVAENAAASWTTSSAVRLIVRSSGRSVSLSRFRWVFMFRWKSVIDKISPHPLCEFAPISLLIYSLDVTLSMLFRQIVAWNDEEHYADSSQNSKDFGFIDAAGCNFSINFPENSMRLIRMGRRRALAPRFFVRDQLVSFATRCL